MHRQWLLVFWLAIIATLGITILKSISPSLVTTQVVFFLMGLGLFGASSLISWPRWLQLSPWLYAGLCFMLAFTLVTGNLTRGSTRWIKVGPVNVQSSQLAIPIVGLYLSRFVHKKRMKDWPDILLSLGIIGLPAGLIFIEPDLGTTLVFLMATGIIVFFTTQNAKILLTLTTLSIAMIGISWLFLLQDYQRARFLSYLEGHQDVQNSGYNAQQALIAVGSGQLWGRGLGLGIQSHLRFLPERHTDFIFASLAEELGFVGSIGLLLWYASLIAFFIYIAEQTTDDTIKWYSYALVMMFASQTIINIGMNIGLLPITGITLPFISYGGSSILSLCLSLGILQSGIKITRPRERLYLT